jgi:hypothetical protein
MDDYTESELYAIFANIGYELNAGMTPEQVEQDIKRDYGLDIELDKELSDEFGAIIKYGDDIIHSVRGTDFYSITDLLADFNLITAHPYYSRIGTLIFSSAVSFKTGIAFMNYNEGNYEDPNFFRNLVTGFANAYYEAVEDRQVRFRIGDLEEGLASIADLTPDEVMDEIDRLRSLERRRSIRDKAQMEKYVKSMMLWLTLPYIIKKSLEYFRSTFLDERVDREFDRFHNAKAKYSNKKMSLTGHSLGAIANDIGRTHNVKSITFNPAPMEHNTEQPHKDSKIYRMENDFISHFLTDNDKEDIQHIPKYSWYNNLYPFLKPHGIDNFLPKRRRLSPSLNQPIVNPSQPPQNVHNRLKSIIKEDVLTRERPIINIMNQYSAMIEDSIEEFLSNYLVQDLSLIHKNKFKKKLKKKIYINYI